MDMSEEWWVMSKANDLPERDPAVPRMRVRPPTLIKAWGAANTIASSHGKVHWRDRVFLQIFFSVDLTSESNSRMERPKI